MNKPKTLRDVHPDLHRALDGMLQHRHDHPEIPGQDEAIQVMGEVCTAALTGGLEAALGVLQDSGMVVHVRGRDLAQTLAEARQPAPVFLPPGVSGNAGMHTRARRTGGV